MSTQSPFKVRNGLQLRVLGAVALPIVMLLLVMYVPLRFLLFNTFTEIETTSVQTDVERLQAALDNSLINLGRVTRDYAHWDDTYEYAVTGDAEYTDSNLGLDGFQALEIDLLLIQDVQGNLLYAQRYNATTESLEPVSLDFIDRYDEVLENHATVTSAITGIVEFESTPMLIASYPVLATGQTGPIRGTFVMGRLIEQSRVQQFERAIRQDVELIVDQQPLAAETQQAQQQLSQANSVYVQPRDATTIAGYTQLVDLLGQPVGLFRLNIPRTVFAQLQNALNYVTLLVGCIALILCAVVVEVIRRFVLRRILRLNAELQAIAAHPVPEARLTVHGSDEISQLSTTINSMLNSIVQTQAARIQADEEREQIQADMIAMQSESLAKLSVPLIPITDRIVVMPLIGAIDANRSARITQTMLEGITERRARTAIVDVTGLQTIDEPVAALLAQLARAAQFVGARMLLTGMRAEVVQTLLDLDVKLEHLSTYSTLQQGITAALSYHQVQTERTPLR